uniref:lipoyl(octanoyl) transferase n=1 Tax=Timema poppense TaxID=170557 RepID=A0A7R9GT44_TIMPO|nr:unnamed protein product [Timema poppensis]
MFWLQDSSSVSGNNGNATVKACDDDSGNLLKFVGRIDYCSSQGECGEACSDMLAMFDSQRCSILGSQPVRLGVDQPVQCSCGVCWCSVYGAGTCSGVPNDVQEELILGFDMEWPVNFKAGSCKTALIQVCPKEDCAVQHDSQFSMIVSSHWVSAIIGALIATQIVVRGCELSVSTKEVMGLLYVCTQAQTKLLKQPPLKGWEVQPLSIIAITMCAILETLTSPEDEGSHLIDFWKLSRDFGILVKPLMEKVIDLGKFANEVLNSNQNWSLDGLVLHLFGKRILKSENIRISDWTKIPLSQEQENYAATDAYKILANRNIELLHQGTPHETEDILILVEHNPVYTVGIRAKEYSADYENNLKQTGAEFYRTNRGGLVTFHGPGQLVAYPILNLKHFNPNVRWYVSQIEKTIIRTCGRLGLAAETSPLTGVWVGDKKICALGLQASRFITTHGLALNCDTDLTWFSHIVPCGIEGKGVTSLSIELKRNVTIEETLPLFLLSFSELFDCTLCDYRKKDADSLIELIGKLK